MNLPTIIALCLVCAAVIGIGVKMIINRKHGKGGCSCGCNGCANKEYCHSKPSTENEK